MSITVLILAAGEQDRWKMDGPPYHKQLLDAGGETIIARIVRQCQERGIMAPVVVTHHERIMKALPGTWVFKPNRRRWTVETLYSTRQMWRGRVIVLLGDVFYSSATMNKIFAVRTAPMRVFGNEYEIFALSFNEPYNAIIAVLKLAIIHAESGIARGGGKLRKFYQIYCGLDPNTNQIEDGVLYSVYDSMDVDNPHDYDGLKKLIKGL